MDKVILLIICHHFQVSQTLLEVREAIQQVQDMDNCEVSVQQIQDIQQEVMYEGQQVINKLLHISFISV